VLSTIVHPNLVEVYGSPDWTSCGSTWSTPARHPTTPNASRTSRAADLAGVEVVLRLPTKDPSLVRKTLDTGVRNILIPRVETAAEVRQTVASAHFSYDGAVGDRGSQASVRTGGERTWTATRPGRTATSRSA